MFDVRYKEMLDAIKDYLIAKHGIAFINMPQDKQCALIADTFIQYMKAQRERQY